MPSDLAARELPNPPRLWPAWLIVALQWFASLGLSILAPATFVQFFGLMIGPGLGLVLLFGWWLKASKGPWRQKLFVVLLPIVAFGLTLTIADPSAYAAVYLYGVPFLCLAFVVWLWLRQRQILLRPITAWVAIVVVLCGGWALVRTTGVDGDMNYDFEPRWQATAEQRLLDSAPNATASERSTGAALALATEAAWPGLRGPERDAVLPGVRLATDWQATPPEELWRRPIGPGWSSFAVVGDVLFTQEQRGEEECVSAYVTSSGESIWLHCDPARFWESMAGAGPRATPTFLSGRVFTVGATGIVNALDATNGSVVWQRNLVDDTGATVPDWGFSASPLVVDGLVVVHSDGAGGKGVVAYDELTGEPRWFAPGKGLSYSSVHLATLDGERQMLISTGDGVTSLGLDGKAEGQVLWQHAWPASGGARVVQPVFSEDGDVIIGTGFGIGLRRLAIDHQGDTWSASEVWTSAAMKPYYNDIAVHRDHVYGFDNRILAAVDLETGERAWKGGRYGNGQLLLLPDQDLLLVLSDRGKLALVDAKPEAFREIATFQALDGKTWNHPALVDGVLYVRNAEEMAALRLSVD